MSGGELGGSWVGAGQRRGWQHSVLSCDACVALRLCAVSYVCLPVCTIKDRLKRVAWLTAHTRGCGRCGLHTHLAADLDVACHALLPAWVFGGGS